MNVFTRQSGRKQSKPTQDNKQMLFKCEEKNK